MEYSQHKQHFCFSEAFQLHVISFPILTLHLDDHCWTKPLLFSALSLWIQGELATDAYGKLVQCLSPTADLLVLYIRVLGCPCGIQDTPSLVFIWDSRNWMCGWRCLARSPLLYVKLILHSDIIPSTEGFEERCWINQVVTARNNPTGIGWHILWWIQSYAWNIFDVCIFNLRVDKKEQKHRILNSS